jgi:aldose 1-epimerase
MLTLRAGDSVLTLAPEQGGSVLGWARGGMALLQPVRGLGCFPLVPYANRIAFGRFGWEGGTYKLPLNFGDHPHSIHGVGWQAPWNVEAADAASVRLALTHDGSGGWPFAFDAGQIFALTANALTVTLRLTNRHSGPVPAGLGLHPFFPRPAGASLRFAAATVWLNDATALPVRSEPVPPHWDHSDGLPVGTDTLDNCFSGWDGTAFLDMGAIQMRIEASPAFGHLQVYTPPGQNFFCIEPVTHRPDAINHSPGMAVLAPGETLEGTVVFRITVG